MDEADTKTCGNCNREIPSVNFTIHVVHCDRNIRICPTCKEPVPISQLKEHQEKLHKAVPCEKCGESVCGTDLEDHIRDSCAHTVKTCRFCELELPRGKLPAHENYCGTRTEQCAECKEFVMIKYTQVHLDCNHGFVRLDDDPVPVPVRKPTNFPTPLTSGNINIPSTSFPDGVKNNLKSSSNSKASGSKAPCNINTAANGSNMASVISQSPNSPIPSGSNSTPVGGNSAPPSKTSIGSNTSPISSEPAPNGTLTPNGNSVEPQRLGWLPNSPNICDPPNNQPNTENSMNESQFVNINHIPSSSNFAQNTRNVPKNQHGNVNVDRNREVGGSGVKKMPLKRTNDQPQININGGAAEKVHKDLSLSRGANKKRPAPPPPPGLTPSPHNPVSSPTYPVSPPHYPISRPHYPAQPPPFPASPSQYPVSTQYPAPFSNSFAQDQAIYDARQRQLEEERGREMMVDDDDMEEARAAPPAPGQLRDLVPMTPQEFMDRFQELQLRRQASREGQSNLDRFNQIKSSLTELRRGLNQVTAPYVSQNINQPMNDNDAEPVTRLPCEFCGRPQPAHDLVLHQTGCRPDLVQYRAGPAPADAPAGAAGAGAGAGEVAGAGDAGGVLIPCEFCEDSLPVYLISQHQERCGLRHDNSPDIIPLD